MDHFQENKKHREISEAIFGKLFGKKDEPKVPENPDFIQKPNGSFVIGGKSTAKKVNTPDAVPYLKEYDWRNSKLNFILFPGTEFHADYIDFDLKGQTINSFYGDWVSGPFYGRHFEGVFEKNGTAFQGNFVGRYTDYEADPKTFVDGTFLDTTKKGLLGMPDIITLHKSRRSKFNFISIPAGNYLQFRSANGITGYIKVLKRLDEVNSNFQYEVLDGFKGQTSPQIVNLPWDYFRQNWDIMYTHPRSPKNIAGLIQVPEGDAIIEMHISSAPATFQTAGEDLGKKMTFEPGKKFGFDLSKLPISVEDAGPSVNVAFDIPQELEEFKKISQYVNSGLFRFDLKNINRGIQYGEVDGYGPFTYLSSLFNKNQGKNIMGASTKRGIKEDKKGAMSAIKFDQPTVKLSGYKSSTVAGEEPKQDVFSSMKRLNDFVKYFVANIVDDAGNPDKAVQTAVMNALKANLDTAAIKSVNPSVTTSKSETPAKTIVKGLGLGESIRAEIRNIISDSF